MTDTTPTVAEEVAAATPEKTTLSPKAPYILVYDTQRNAVVAYHEWGKPVNMTVFKAAFIKAIEDHGDAYGRDIGSLVQAGAKIQQLHGGKADKNPFPRDIGMGLINRMQARVEDAFRRINDYQASYGQEFSVLLPYAELRMQGEGIIDTRQSRPFQNGWLFTAVYLDEVGRTVALELAEPMVAAAPAVPLDSEGQPVVETPLPVNDDTGQEIAYPSGEPEAAAKGV